LRKDACDNIGRMWPDTEPQLAEARRLALSMMECREPLRDILTHLASTAEALGGRQTVASILVIDEEGLLRMAPRRTCRPTTSMRSIA
jgi:hypothetical protein